MCICAYEHICCTLSGVEAEKERVIHLKFMGVHKFT